MKKKLLNKFLIELNPSLFIFFLPSYYPLNYDNINPRVIVFLCVEYTGDKNNKANCHRPTQTEIRVTIKLLGNPGIKSEHF